MDYAALGKQVGWLQVPHSTTQSAYGVVAVPIAVLNNGAGPRILLTASNHGDEYEGQVVLTRLIQSLQAEDIRGRLIVIPALNTPAAMAGARVTPLDGGNLNRAFPGDANAGPTWKIADYLQNHLIPMVNAVGDFHGGGSRFTYRPHASTHFAPDVPAALKAQSLAVVKAPGVPHMMVFATKTRADDTATATRRHGKIYLNGEYGGMGALTAAGTALVETAIRRLLAFFGVLARRFEPAPPLRVMHVPGPLAYVYAPEGGVFIQARQLRERVREGDLCGELLFPETPGRAPLPLHFKAAGELVAQRHPAWAERGDCLAHLAQPLP